MYYISKETFEELSPELQEKAVSDDKAYRSGEMGEEEMRGTGGEKEDAEMMTQMMNEKDEGLPEGEKVEKKRSFDHASDKGMAVLIAMGKPKGKKPAETEVE